jgi:hypothetical protein
MLMEAWKDIPGYEGLYQVSNLGRVKSLARYRMNNGNSQTFVEERILKPFICGKGYCKVELSKNGTAKPYGVHRLVATAFLTNINNYPQVNHKDENKLNNNAENLEWCDNFYNVHYGTGIRRCADKRSVPVIARNIITNEVIIYKSMACAVTDGFDRSNISKCCRGIYKQYRGFTWMYASATNQQYQSGGMIC